MSWSNEIGDSPRTDDPLLLDPYSWGVSCETLYYIPPTSKGGVAIASRANDLSHFSHSQLAPPEQGSSKVGAEVVCRE